MSLKSTDMKLVNISRLMPPLTGGVTHFFVFLISTPCGVFLNLLQFIIFFISSVSGVLDMEPKNIYSDENEDA